MLVTTNKINHMALHGSHASQITSSKILVTQTLFRVSNEIGPILFSRFLDNNSLKEFWQLVQKYKWKRKEEKKED